MKALTIMIKYRKYPWNKKIIEISSTKLLARGIINQISKNVATFMPDLLNNHKCNTTDVVFERPTPIMFVTGERWPLQRYIGCILCSV